MKLIDLLNKFSEPCGDENKCYYSGATLSFLMEYGGNGLIEGEKQSGRSSGLAWLTPEGVAVRKLLRGLAAEKNPERVFTPKRIVGWGNMSGEDKCVRCGTISSLLVECEGDFEPQPMCSTCVPIKTPDPVAAVLVKAFGKEKEMSKSPSPSWKEEVKKAQDAAEI